MSSAILTAIGKMVASAIFSQISKYLFKPDPVNIDAILAGQQKIIDLITELDYKSQIREPMNLIYYWTKRMQEVVDDINRTNSSQASINAYNDLLTALRSQSSGIRYSTYVIYSAVVGTVSPLGTDGMLLYWEGQAYKKLRDEANFTYFMQDYIDELDTDIAAVFALLHHGLELSFFTAIDSTDAQNLKTECETRMNAIRGILFNNYPYVMRTFKSNNYDNAGSWYTNSWLNLWAGNSYLIINNFYCRELSTSTTGTTRAVQLRPTGKTFGPAQMHAYWQDNGSSRVGYYRGLPDGITVTRSFTNTARYASYQAILFKVVPLKDNNNASNNAKLVPYNQGTTTATGPSDNNLFGKVFTIQQAGNPQ